MKPQTRDNLIYLAVGITVAGVLVGLDFYAESHGKPYPRISKFAFRAATTPLVTGYFVARQARRRLNATLTEVIMCLLVGGLLSLAISFVFRQDIGQLPGIPYAGFAVLEIFLIVELVTRAVSYFRRMARSGSAES